jgi:hypothetical protein
LDKSFGESGATGRQFLKVLMWTQHYGKGQPRQVVAFSGTYTRSHLIAAFE